MIYTRKSVFVNVSVPSDHNIKTKDKGRFKMYTNVQIDVTSMWDVLASIIVMISGSSWCIARV